MERPRRVRRPAPPTTATTPALELRPDRAFVLHLDAHSQPPRRVVGRVEHISSGQVAHIASARALLKFFADVLWAQARASRPRAAGKALQAARRHGAR